MAYEAEVFLLGRILLGGYFTMMGMMHFMKQDMLAGFARSKGAPSPIITVPLTGLFLILGGLSVLLGVYTTVGLALLALFFVLVTPIMHDFWALEGEEKMQQMQNFMRNMALLGAVLILSFVQIWPYALATPF